MVRTPEARELVGATKFRRVAVFNTPSTASSTGPVAEIVALFDPPDSWMLAPATSETCLLARALAVFVASRFRAEVSCWRAVVRASVSTWMAASVWLLV